MWFGKLARLSEDTPARVALLYGLSDYSKPRGKPKITWISSIKKALGEMNLTWLEAENIAKEHPEEWVNLIKNYVFK